MKHKREIESIKISDRFWIAKTKHPHTGRVMRFYSTACEEHAIQKAQDWLHQQRQGVAA